MTDGHKASQLTGLADTKWIQSPGELTATA
jgi:hypothetical protein